MNPRQTTWLKYPIFIPAFTGVGLWFSDTLMPSMQLYLIYTESQYKSILLMYKRALISTH